MSATTSLHYELCVEGARWLHRQKWNYDRCTKKPCYHKDICRCPQCNYVAVELCTWGGENTDVWGLGNFCESVVIEVKTSHSDFLADKKKWCRSEDAEKKGLVAGRKRYFLCPEGVIKKDELPEKWGLLYWDGKKIIPVVGATPFENTYYADMLILTSIMRRENFPQKVFNYRGAPSTIKPLTIFE